MSSLQTPRRPGLARPSLGGSSINTASSPNLQLSASTAIARKASLSALTAGSSVGMPSTPGSRNLGGDGREIEAGDLVDVPGGMHGTVRFLGQVKGKKGTFAGVELSSEFAGRGKNDGDVDGIYYFRTSAPSSGIFLPVSRATKRSSPSAASEGFPATPTTPSYSNYSVGTKQAIEDDNTPPVATIRDFSKSVGPGVRPTSPLFKSKTRPSLPRPESPFRRQPGLAPTPGRNPSFGPAKNALTSPRSMPSPAPGKIGSVKTRTPGPPPRPFSRSNSRLGQHHDTINEDGEPTPTGSGRPGSLAGRGKQVANAEAEAEIQRLKKELEEKEQELQARDKQLKDQADSLAEVERNLAELSDLMPTDMNGGLEDANPTQLRALIREKNEKIAMMTAEFDGHRADFRSTIDALESASTETARIYEKKVEDLLHERDDLQHEIEELQQELRDLRERDEDVESVATQLRQLEDLVQELEEGLEDARRGEAEARGEVEFLRGEVERGRSELRREREKAAEAVKNAESKVNGSTSAGGSRDIEARDDEIRGLKAIIHSLSSGPDMGSPSLDRRTSLQRSSSHPAADADEAAKMKAAVERLEREKSELQGLIERKSFREEELEAELDRLRRSSLTNGNGHGVVSPPAKHRVSALSDRTIHPTQDKRSSARDSKGTVLSWRGPTSPPPRQSEPQPLAPTLESPPHLHPAAEDVTRSPDRSTEHGTDIDVQSQGTLWCEICEESGHDVLNCPTFNVPSSAVAVGGSSHAVDLERDTTPRSPRSPTNRRSLGLGADMKMAMPPPSSIAFSKATGANGLGGQANGLSVSSSGMNGRVNGNGNGSDYPMPLTPKKSPRPSHSPSESSPAPAPVMKEATGLGVGMGMATATVTGEDAVAGKSSGVVDMSRWCALCERDGHESVDCPFEEEF